MALTGGCLCGSVTYQAERQFASSQTTNYCHCRMCQRSSGSPCLVFTTVPEGAFRWTKGQPQVYQSSKGAHREFCGKCGCNLTFVEPGSSGVEVSFTTATLDEPEVVHPSVHIFSSTKLRWLAIKDELPHFTEGRDSAQL